MTTTFTTVSGTVRSMRATSSRAVRIGVPLNSKMMSPFETDEMEEDREEVRREMEARLRDYATRG